MKTSSLKPTASSLIFDRSEAVAAKRALQTALELVNRVHAQLMPGPLADALDHSARQIVTGITLLRDSDSNCGMRKTERTDPSDKSASSSRLPAPSSTPPGGSP